MLNLKCIGKYFFCIFQDLLKHWKGIFDHSRTTHFFTTDFSKSFTVAARKKLYPRGYSFFLETTVRRNPYNFWKTNTRNFIFFWNSWKESVCKTLHFLKKIKWFDFMKFRNNCEKESLQNLTLQELQDTGRPKR